LVTLSMAQSLRPPVVAVLIALLADRKEALIDRKGSFAVILGSCAFFMFLSGFIAGDVMEAIMANVAAGREASERALVNREQWVDAFESGLLGLWIIFILMISHTPQSPHAF